MTRVSFRPSALKVLTEAPRQDQLRINAAVDALREGSFSPHARKLEGVAHGYRTRVGRWRVLFILKDEEIDVADIFLKKSDGDYRRRLKGFSPRNR